jgi:hypothetical protein
MQPDQTQSACCDSGDGIYSTATSNIRIQGNVIAYGEDNILLVQSNGGSVIGNFLLNPRNYGGNRGANIQLFNGTVNMTVQNNYTLASDDPKYAYPQKQEDSINFIGAAAHTANITAQGNYVTGGTSTSGCGMIADSGADGIRFLENILVDTGQCGIGIADGVGHVIDSNRIVNTRPIANAGNTAIYVWKVHETDPPCGEVQVTNNVAAAINTRGQDNSYYDAGGCGLVTVKSNTVDSAARARLLPALSKLPAPRIPPQPATCVVASPFSNQKEWPLCDARKDARSH